MLALLLAPPAHAACAVEQRQREGAMDVVIQALAEPVGCRTITLTSDAPLTVAAVVWSPEERRRRVPADHLRLLPGGGWEIGVPELMVNGRVELAVGVTGGKLDVQLAPATPMAVRAEAADETHVLTLDARHPGWGFADPKKASTQVTVSLRFASDTPEQIVPVPMQAENLDAGPLAPVPGGVRVPAGVKDARITYTLPGASPQGVRTLAPGSSLTLVGPGVVWRTTAGPGVTVVPVQDGVRFEAPSGGEARWRVERAGDASVIPDLATFVAGIDWKFARVSLPEPAVPVELRGRRERAALYDDLLRLVGDLRPGALPGVSDLAPRPLNRAWRSGWATPVERALIFHRFLGQERYRAGWVLTGDAADPETLTGYDHLLVTVYVDGALRWVDPTCTVCAPGEVGTRWLGKPALGLDVTTGMAAPGAPSDAPEAAPEETPKETARAALAPMAPLPVGATVPRAAGRLDRAIALDGTVFRVRYTASGAAALWLRERLSGVDPALRSARLAEALGVRDATRVEATGLGEAGATVTVTLESERAPSDPFDAPDAAPWAGGWGDAL